MTGETKDKSGSYGHVHTLNNLLVLTDLVNQSNVFVKDGVATNAGLIWLEGALDRLGPKLIENLRPELQTAARKILNRKQK